MHARMIVIGLVAAAALVGAAALGAASAPTAEGEIVACQKRNGYLRVVHDVSHCGHDEQLVRWNVQGPAGPPGPASLASLDGTSCSRSDGSAGTVEIATNASNIIELTCSGDGGPPPPPPPPAGGLVINEIDYDQVGTDAGGFVEIANPGTSAATLDGLAIVLVNGGDGEEYERAELTGTLTAGSQLAVALEAQNGAPDGVALVDTAGGTLLDALSYEGEIRAAQIGGQTYDLVEGTPLTAEAADSNTVDGSLSRLPDGADTNDAATDWAFTTTKTPGAVNVASG